MALASESNVPVSLLPFAYSNSTWHPRQANGESQGPELAPQGLVSSGPKCLAGHPDFVPRAGEPGKVWSRSEPVACAFTLERAALGPSKQGWTGGIRAGLLLRARPPPPPVSLWAAAASPAGEEALPHSRGCDSRPSGLAPAPRRCPAGASGRGTGALSRYSHSWGFFSSVLPASAGWVESNEPAAVRGVWSRLRVFRGHLRPGHLYRLAGEDRGPAGTEPGPEPWPPVCNSPGFHALSTCSGCQFSYLQTGAKPRPRGARERTHHHGGDRLARDVGHLDPNLETKPSSGKPAAKIPTAAPSLLNKGTPTRAAPS